MRWILLAVLLGAAVGCASDRDGWSHKDSPTVAEFKRASGLEFEICPLVSRTSCPTEDCTCTPKRRAEADCLLEAAAACRPAHATVIEWLDEDGWIVTDILVVPRRAPGCDIVEFTDLTHVVDHCHRITRSTCSGVRFDEDWWDCSFRTVGCSGYEEVVTDPRPQCNW